MSAKRYFKAHYRIFDEIEYLEYNEGYICINEDSSIVGKFTFDIAYINFCDDLIIFSIPFKDVHSIEVKQLDFIGKCCDGFKPMSHYVLVADEICLYLKIGEEIRNPTALIKELFENPI